MHFYNFSGLELCQYILKMLRIWILKEIFKKTYETEWNWDTISDSLLAVLEQLPSNDFLLLLLARWSSPESC